MIQLKLSAVSLLKYRSSHRRCSVRKCVVTNFTKFTGNHLCQGLYFKKVAGFRPATLFKKRVWHRYFPANIAKFLRTPFLQNTSGRLFLKIMQTLFQIFLFTFVSLQFSESLRKYFLRVSRTNCFCKNLLSKAFSCMLSYLLQLAQRRIVFRNQSNFQGDNFWKYPLRTNIHKLFETNTSFYVKQRTKGKFQFPFFAAVLW